jgi:hypothetical protein
MDYTIIARKGDDGKPLAGTFEAVKRDDRRIGARGWWGGRSMMGLQAAQREVARRNAGAAPSTQRPAATANEEGALETAPPRHPRPGLP